MYASHFTFGFNETENHKIVFPKRIIIECMRNEIEDGCQHDITYINIKRKYAFTQ